MSNEVSHPSHYCNHPSGVECIQIVQHEPYNVGVAMAYCWRHRHKGNPVRDLKKAIQHLEFEVTRLIEMEGKENQLRGQADVFDAMCREQPVNGLRHCSPEDFSRLEVVRCLECRHEQCEC